MFHTDFSIEQKIISGPNEVWVKRDDLIHPVVSGNKWRKLKHLISEVTIRNLGGVITFGGAFSNHLIATANVCSMLNLECHLIIRGEEPKERNHYLTFCKALGAQLHFVSREDYRDKAGCLEKLPIEVSNYLMIPEGGAHPLAHKGCMEIITELQNDYDYIYLASGTGTTAMGLAMAIKEFHKATRLMVVPVLKNEQAISELLEPYPFAEVMFNQHLGGYAKTNSDLFREIEKTVLKYGILLDPIYTAKSFMAMLEHCKSMQKKKILFLHTGGTFGLFSDFMIKQWNKSLLD